MSKYGSSITYRYRDKSSEKFSLESLNNTCLIVAFLFFIIALIPELNTGLFITISIVFLLRSFKGKMSVFRALWLIIGSFALGALLTAGLAGIINSIAVIVLVVISVPMLMLGFKSSDKKNKKEFSNAK